MENLTTFYYRYLRYMQAKDDTTATPYDKYMALSYAVRSRMVDRWIETQKMYHLLNPRRVYYLSTEYLWGKNLKHSLINLGLEKSATDAAESLGFSLEELYKQEDDFELGNAGRGRLAACIMDSMATLGIPAMGYGLYYDYALFRQHMRNGFQTEQPSDWIHKAHPWEIRRPEYLCSVDYYGTIRSSEYLSGQTWIPSEHVHAIPYDFPIPGYQNNTVNTLRLWSAQASEEFLHDYVNHRDYVRACEEKYHSGRLTNYLFPDEDIHRATEMRIKQHYFFISASLQDIIRRYKLHNNSIADLDKKIVIHLNGSRCAIAIPEMMRILVDVEHLSWNDAWRMSRNIFAYTSHAVNFDNLEKWPLYLFEQIIPRHLRIIFDINQQHLDNVKSKGNYKDSVIRELSIIEEGEVKWVKMANLAVLGSMYVNGVSLMQTEMLEKRIFATLSSTIPTIIKNKTNGISLRRWLLVGNKPLAGLITELIGDSWIRNFEEMERLAEFSTDSEVLARLSDLKHAIKRQLSSSLSSSLDLVIDSDAFLDVNCKKIHPFKRHMLHVLFILHQYLRLKKGEDIGIYRCHILGGKAAPSDFLAKQIIHLIHIISTIINNDPIAKKKLSVHFVANYGIALAEKIVPAADLSEQLSSPLFEACGTSNMKFAVNGALVLASRGGSNLEMAERIGEDSIILFGLNYKELSSIKSYSPSSIIDSNTDLQAIFDYLEDTLPDMPEGSRVYPLLASLRDTDPYFVLLDFQDYVKKQQSINELYLDKNRWLSLCFKNIARTGWFSSDRLVEEYARDIWKVSKV
ncbi:MAG: glycogen/starch/alpha-glucan family phosphorylase [Chitinivibrionales bacterium]|nr:glycogen/starch/alpha-glucan family phosphorylase [Chitinivibrionales bacterium]